MGFLPYNTAVVLAGVSLLGMSAGVIGVFALLRRRALLGDATAHAGLPGLCLAFMIVGQRSMPALLAGALLSGLAGVGVLSLLRRWTRLKEDAGLALVLSLFYALGVVLLSIIVTSWRGAGASGLNSFLVGTTAGMGIEDVFWLGGLAVVTLLAVGALFKEMKLIAFDADFAQTQGWPVFGLDYFLNLLVVIAIVVGLPAVGVLMTAALLVIPAAAARFWTDRLGLLLVLSGGFGLLGTLAGTLLTHYVEKLAAGPTIILSCAALFMLSLLFGSRRGLLARWSAQRQFHARLARHRLLCQLYAEREGTGKDLGPVRQAAPAPHSAYRSAARAGLLERHGAEWSLTAVGSEVAAQAARRQAMATRYLESHPELASSLANWFLTEDDAPPRAVDPLKV